MVGAEQGRDPAALARLREREPLRPAHVLLALDEDVDAHRRIQPSRPRARASDQRPRPPHFGALLDWEEFNRLTERIHAAKLPFILEPRIRYPGQPGEQATMFLLDLSGNALEFKSFRHPEHVFTA